MAAGDNTRALTTDSTVNDDCHCGKLPEAGETMTTLVVILVIAALVGGVIWNHRNKSTAAEGVEFHLPEPPQEVAAAITALYCRGAKAGLRSVVSRISVTPIGPTGFNFGTKIGDQGQIEVHPGSGSGSVVRASTSTLYIGSHPSGHFKTGLMAISAAITNALFRMLGIAPYAAKMKRFQSGLEQRVARQIGRQTA